MVDVGDIALHVVEQGHGLPVVMCHGFPGLWYSWRHQLPVLAEAGYRAIAVDMRGYGRSGRPASPASYDRRHTVADMVGLLDGLGIEEAVFVGHDFGAALVWDLPQWAPGRVKALMQLSVPRMPVSKRPPTELYARMAEQHFVHVHYFQEQGLRTRNWEPHRSASWRTCSGRSAADTDTSTSGSTPAKATVTSMCCPKRRPCRGHGCRRRSSPTTSKNSAGRASPVGSTGIGPTTTSGTRSRAVRTSPSPFPPCSS